MSDYERDFCLFCRKLFLGKYSTLTQCCKPLKPCNYINHYPPASQ